MTIAARMLIDQGAALGVPPRSRAERQAFGSWLASALKFVGMSRASLVSRTGISREDIDAMLDDESRGTAKGDRAFVHDFVLDRIEEREGSVRPHGDDATSRVSDVVAGRAEFATFFSPRDDLRSAIVRVIESARAGILIQAWDLSCKIIGDALMAAKVGKGSGKIMIAVSTTRGEKLSAALQALAAEPRVRVLCDRDGRNNHNKTIVVDRRFLLTGSVNFNYGSGRCDENLLFTSRPELVRAYAEDFDGKLRARLEDHRG